MGLFISADGYTFFISSTQSSGRWKRRKTIDTKLYEISANGTTFGVFEGVDERSAIEAYVRDAGCRSIAAAAAVVGQSEDEFLSDIDISLAVEIGSVVAFERGAHPVWYDVVDIHNRVGLEVRQHGTAYTTSLIHRCYVEQMQVKAA